MFHSPLRMETHVFCFVFFSPPLRDAIQKLEEGKKEAAPSRRNSEMGGTSDWD